MKIHSSYFRTPELHIRIFIQQQQACRAQPRPGRSERERGREKGERESALVETFIPGLEKKGPLSAASEYAQLRRAGLHPLTSSEGVPRANSQPPGLPPARISLLSPSLLLSLLS